MNEFPPNKFEDENSREEERKREIMALATELSESQEVFPFPGMNESDYLEAKAGDLEYPGYTTPVDELIKRCQNEGMKVVLGEHPESGNVFILPANSDDAAKDSIYPRQLRINPGMNEKLKELIRLKQSQR